jgi:hypothetical protein
MLGIGKTNDQKMRKLISLFVCLFIFGFNSNAQKGDSTLISRYRPGFMWFYSGVHSSKCLNVAKYDRLIVDVLYNDWGSKEFSFFKSNWKSIGFNIQSFYDTPLNKNNTVGIGWGIGYGHSRIESDYILNQTINSNATFLTVNSANSGIERFSFSTNQIFVPIELRLRTDGWQHFKFQVGGRIGYSFLPKKHLFGRNAEGKLIENITNDFKDFNQSLLSALARIGIRNWALTASYNLLPYFKSKSSTQVNGLQLGLSISLF